MIEPNGRPRAEDEVAPERRGVRTPIDRAWVRRAAEAYLAHAPLALAVREVNRLIALRALKEEHGLPSDGPLLDVGCGDGFWWELLPERDAVWGIDIAEGEIAQARSRIRAEVFDVSKGRPFPGVTFRGIIGNCSLEHVRDVSTALANLRSAAADGAVLILFVPSPYWAFQGKVLDAVLRRAPRVAMTASGALNGFFQHWHLYEPAVWESILVRAGFRLVAAHGLGNARSEFLFRLFLPASLPSFFLKNLVGAYPARALTHLPSALKRPGVELLDWALDHCIVDVNDRSAYEYVLVAEAAPR